MDKRVIAFRDPESGILIRNDKSGRKMPRSAQVEALRRMASKYPQPHHNEPAPF